MLVFFLILVFVVAMFNGCSGDTVGKTAKPKKDYSNIEMNPNIAIPGYESLDLKAGKKKQSVNFYNPQENTCYFRISLIMKRTDDEATGKEPENASDVAPGIEQGAAGSAENETVLWTSELIKPGEQVKSIKLEQTLKSGEYPAILRYECFSLKDMSPFNGSDIALTIHVR